MEGMQQFTMNGIAKTLHALDPSSLVASAIASTSAIEQDGQPKPAVVSEWKEGMQRRIVIVLLRNDLRIHDNAALYYAHHHASNPTHILPLYVFDERHIECSALPGYNRKGPEARTRLCGFWRTGVFRARFLAEAVYDVQHRLREQGSDLLIRFGITEDIVENLIKALQQRGDVVTGLELQKEICAEETAVEKRLAKCLAKLGLPPINFHHSRPMIHPEDLPFSISDTPDVFTPFRKRVEGLGPKMIRPMLEMPETFLPFPESKDSKIPDGCNYGKEVEDQGIENVLAYFLEPLKGSYEMKYADPNFSKHKSSAFPWAGGETSALERLEWYFVTGNPPPVSRYKETRNMLVGHAYSTKMSPYLSIGCVSPRMICKALDDHEQRYGSTQNTYWVRFELLWRDYFMFVSEKFGNNLFKIEGFEQMTDPKQAKQKKDGWNNWSPDNYLIKAWMRGRTGVPFIDANIVELRETGFMSNRGRQNVASFLTKDLYFDWRIGAEFFESHLVDYEPTANWSNWQYVSGVGNDPRASRQFNPIKQARDYDPSGEYVRTWIAQLQDVPASKIHTPWLMSDEEWNKYTPSRAKVADQSISQNSAQPTMVHGSRRQRLDPSRPDTARMDATKSDGLKPSASQPMAPDTPSGYGSDHRSLAERSDGAGSSAQSSSEPFNARASGRAYDSSGSGSGSQPVSDGDDENDAQSSAGISSTSRSSAVAVAASGSERSSTPSSYGGSSSSNLPYPSSASSASRGSGSGQSAVIAKEAQREVRSSVEAQRNTEVWTSQGAAELQQSMDSKADYFSVIPYPRKPLFEQQSWKPHYHRKDLGRRRGGAGGGNSRRLIRPGAPVSR